MDPHAVAYYPAWETLPHERLSPRSDTVGRRLAVLRRLAHPGDDVSNGPVKVVVAPVRSVLQPQVKGLADLEPVELTVGDEVELDDVVRRLAAAAYHRVDLVEKRGEFAVRGGIVDVFPPTEEHPLRVEFFGDEVEEVRSFSVADQRTARAQGRAAVGAAVPRAAAHRRGARSRRAQLGERHPSCVRSARSWQKVTPSRAWSRWPRPSSTTWSCWSTCMPADTHVLALDPERVRSRAHDLVATSEEFLHASWAAAATGGQAPIDLGAASYRSPGRRPRAHAGPAQGLVVAQPVRPRGGEATEERGRLESTPDDDDQCGREQIGAGSAPAEAYHGDVERAVADIRAWLAAGGRVAAVYEGHGPAERMVELLREHDVAARFVDDLATAADVPAGVAVVTCGTLAHGLVDEEQRLAIVTGDDIVGQRSSTKDMRRMPVRRKKQIDPLELKAGDFVVHEQHGVGRYVEMKQRVVQGATREYLVLEYGASKRGGPPDRLYVPTDQLDQVTRYVGGDMPSLDRLGGADWAKRKGRARKAVRQIAAELIKLYAARQATKGHRFGPDSPWQRELEDAFPFVETPDQLTTVEEVKRDMEREMPMDRLVCGDVGYGKTEIAVRAAFKAVQDGKQVAVLVPTTLLVQQHWSTFQERMGTFPVNLKALSRFQSDKEAKETLEGLADGTVDIVIGTHRLLNPDIRFKDLGLVIVDEEQRFGVEHKELLKQLRTAVDVLAMSATPDPADPRDGDHRHPRDVHDHHPARGAAPRAQLRRRLRGPADRRGHPAGAAARGAGLLHPQPGPVDREGGRADPGAGARGAGGHRARPDGGAPARAGDGRLLGEAVRRPRRHHDRRVGPGRLQREHAGHRAGRHAWASASCTSSAGGSAGAVSAPTPTSCTRRRSR